MRCIHCGSFLWEFAIALFCPTCNSGCDLDVARHTEEVWDL